MGWGLGLRDRLRLTLTAAVAVVMAAFLVALLDGCGEQARRGPLLAGSLMSRVVPDAGAAAAQVKAAPARRARSLVGQLSVHEAPVDGSGVVSVLSARTSMGSSRVLLVLAVVGDWVQVGLPVRPNGSAGWVRSQDVALDDVHERILVDLRTRTLLLQVDGAPVWSTPVGIGALATPTPTGSFYVTDRVRTTDPLGAYGPFALGLSAHSDTLTAFGDGDAQIGIHGTNEPSSVGSAATHGCLRLANSAALRLRTVPLGTPVEIVS